MRSKKYNRYIFKKIMMDDKFSITYNINIYIKNICRLIHQSNGAVDILYCHEMFNEQYKKEKNSNAKNMLLDLDTKKRWDALVDRKNDLVENVRDKNRIIEEQKEIISKYETKSTFMEDKECHTDFFDLDDHNNKKKVSEEEKKIILYSTTENTKIEDNINNEPTNNIENKMQINKEDKKIYFYGNDCTNYNNNHKKEDDKYDDDNDDKESISTSNFTNNSMTSSSITKTRTMDKNEWILYQEGITKWITQYEKLSDMVDVVTGKKSLLDWTHISILTNHFNHESELNFVDNRTFGGLLRELKRKRCDDFEWLISANKKWNIKRNKKQSSNLIKK